MADSRPKVLLACNQHVRHNYLAAADIERLEIFADWDWFECEGGGSYDANEDPETAKKLGERLGGFDGLVLCHGCPTVNTAILDQAPELKIIGELEGDRFASRLDVEAAWERDIVVCSRIRLLRQQGHVRTISWYQARGYLPDVVEV